MLQFFLLFCFCHCMLGLVLLQLDTVRALAQCTICCYLHAYPYYFFACLYTFASTQWCFCFALHHRIPLHLYVDKSLRMDSLLTCTALLAFTLPTPCLRQIYVMYAVLCDLCTASLPCIGCVFRNKLPIAELHLSLCAVGFEPTTFHKLWMLCQIELRTC